MRRCSENQPCGIVVGEVLVYSIFFFKKKKTHCIVFTMCQAFFFPFKDLVVCLFIIDLRERVRMSGRGGGRGTGEREGVRRGRSGLRAECRARGGPRSHDPEIITD